MFNGHSHVNWSISKIFYCVVSLRVAREAYLNTYSLVYKDLFKGV